MFVAKQVPDTAADQRQDDGGPHCQRCQGGTGTACGGWGQDGLCRSRWGSGRERRRHSWRGDGWGSRVRDEYLGCVASIRHRRDGDGGIQITGCRCSGGRRWWNDHGGIGGWGSARRRGGRNGDAWQCSVWGVAVRRGRRYVADRGFCIRDGVRRGRRRKQWFRSRWRRVDYRGVGGCGGSRRWNEIDQGGVKIPGAWRSGGRRG